MNTAVLEDNLVYSRSRMGFFDKAVDTVSTWLNKSADHRNQNPDDGFDQLFTESMARAQATTDAIHAGNLVAASSIVTGEEVDAALRYANALGFARTDTTTLGAANPSTQRSFVDQLAARTDRDPSRGR